MPFRPTASGPNPYIIRNSGVGKTARGPFRPTGSGKKSIRVPKSYYAVFVYIREPFLTSAHVWWGFELHTYVWGYVSSRMYTKTLRYIRPKTRGSFGPHGYTQTSTFWLSWRVLLTSSSFFFTARVVKISKRLVFEELYTAGHMLVKFAYVCTHNDIQQCTTRSLFACQCRFDPRKPRQSPYITRNSGVEKWLRWSFSTHWQWEKVNTYPKKLLVYEQAYVPMYVKRLAIVYVCGRFSYLCTFVEPAIFVYIREPFSFGPTFGEDFGFDVMFLLM